MDEPAKKARMYISPNVMLVLLIALAIPIGIYLMQRPTQSKSLAAEGNMLDVNRDGRINIEDVAAIRDAIAKNQYRKSADLNRDDKVDTKDIEVFYSHYSLR